VLGDAAVSEVANASMFLLSFLAINKTVPVSLARAEHLPPSCIVDHPAFGLEPPERDGFRYKIVGRQILGGAVINIPLAVGWMDDI